MYMKKIKLKHGEIVLVDDQDYKELNKYSWCLNGGGYASRRINTHKSLLMHRYLKDTPKGMETDHINGNKLDNRRKNLRNVTHSQNQLHNRIPRNNTSGVKGVTWDKKNKMWQSQIKFGGKNVFLGRYKDLEMAKVARLSSALVIHELYFTD